MSKDKLTDALGGIGDDLILEAKKSRAGIIFLRRFVAASACLAILMGAFFMLLPKNEPDATDPVLQNTTATPVAPTTAPTTMPSIAPTTIKPTQPTTILPPTSSTVVSSTAAPSTTTRPADNQNPSSSTVAVPTHNEQPAIPMLVISTGEMYAEMFAAAEDQTIFAQSQPLIRTFGNRDELKEFLVLLQSLPLPSIDGMRCISLEYFPTFQRLALAYSADNGLSYGFMFDLDLAQVADTKKNLQRDDLINEQTWTVTGADSFVTVTDLQKGLATNLGQNYNCWLEINGVWAYLNCSQAPNNLTLDAIIARISIGNALYW